MRLTLSAALLAVAVDGFASKRLPSLRQAVRVQDANAVTEVRRAPQPPRAPKRPRGPEPPRARARSSKHP